jgi:hypothetical protein
MATPGSAVNPKNKKKSATNAANPGSGNNPYASSGAASGPNALFSDTSVVPILDQAGDDPWQLGNLIPNVGPGHAPLTVGARVASVPQLTLAQQQQLGGVLAQAGIIASKANYSTSEVQNGLKSALKFTQESGTGSLSRTLTERAQQSGGTTPAGSTTVENAARVNETTYTPQDIQDAVNTTAQKLIGRNATPDEVAAVAAVMNQSSASKAQGAASSEMAAEQADISTKNAVNNASQVSGTTTSAGATYSGNFATDLLNGLGLPTSAQNVAAINAWHQAEGGNAAFNPLNTTQGAPGASNYNKVGVKNYTSYQEGLQATLQTLKNGHYGNILGALKAGNDAMAVANAVGSSPWGTSGNLMARVLATSSKLGVGNIPNQPAQSGAQTVSATSGPRGVISPVGPGLKQGRTDQGVDYSGKGALFAVGSGTILSTSNPGWPGGSFVALQLDNPVDAKHSVVYYAEDINPNVRPGQHVGAGTQIGTATGGHSGIEIGWADPNSLGRSLQAASGAYSGSGATPEGQHFLNYIQGGSNILGTAQAGNTTDIYQQPIITDVPSQESPSDAAAYYFENKDSPDFQKNNLLNVFQMIQAKLGTPQANVSVRSTPVVMK